MSGHATHDRDSNDHEQHGRDLRDRDPNWLILKPIQAWKTQSWIE
jgi:hypothetical protein